MRPFLAMLLLAAGLGSSWACEELNGYRTICLREAALVMPCHEWAALVEAVEGYGAKSFRISASMQFVRMTHNRARYYQAFSQDAIEFHMEHEYQNPSHAFTSALSVCMNPPRVS